MACNVIMSTDTSVDDLSDNTDNSAVLHSDLLDFNQHSITTKYITESESHSFFRFDDLNAINLLHLNCRSLMKNFTGLQNLLSIISGKLTAIALTETWLTLNSKSTFHLPGYNFFHIHV